VKDDFTVTLKLAQDIFVYSEAIINTANPSMQHNKGISKTISDIAGKNL